MFDDLKWDTILQAWPWFGAAAVVFVVAVRLFIALKPKPIRQPETAADAADKMRWTQTGRIDLADPQDRSRHAILESIWLIGFESSSCDCPVVQVASLFDGLSFDGFAAFEYGRSFAGVDVSRR
jgi:hypothetical protein